MHQNCVRMHQNCGGESWLNNYIDTLSADDKQKNVESKSDTKFKFEMVTGLELSHRESR